MSLLNNDDELPSAEEPVNSVEMEDVSATEMDTTPCTNQDEPIEGAGPVEGGSSPIEMGSPIEKYAQVPEEANDAEMENSNEMEVCPPDKEMEPPPANIEELISETSEASSANKGRSFEEESVNVAEAGDNVIGSEKAPIEDTEIEKSPVVDAEMEKSPVVDAEKEKSPVVDAEMEKSPVVDAEMEKAVAEPAMEPVNINEEDSTSNQMGALEAESGEGKEDKEDAESSGRASATNFATFDDDSRLSSEKVTVDNVEDVNINESTAVEADEVVPEEHEGADPLEAADGVDESKVDDGEEILGSHSTHIPVAGEEIERESDDVIQTSSKNLELPLDVPKSEVEEIDCSVEEAKESEAETPAVEESEYEELDQPLNEICHQCNMDKECCIRLKTNAECTTKYYLCSKECCSEFKNRPKITAVASTKLRVLDLNEPSKEAEIPESEPDLTRRCFHCKNELSSDKISKLSWQSMEYCSEQCIESYQNELGACCANCKGDVPQASMGKYCVRFGYNARQFCSSKCLEEFKKGLKVCSYCQRDISGEIEGFLAPIGDKGQFKDFCSKNCMDDYDIMVSNKPKPVIEDNCAVCSEKKTISIEVIQLSGIQRLCSDPCFAAFKFANNLQADCCELCKRKFDELLPGRQRVYYNDIMHNFCSKKCLNVHTLSTRKIVSCNWCKVKKYNFDMIETSGPNSAQLCSLKCLQLHKVSHTSTSTSNNMLKCDYCNKVALGLYHVNMPDGEKREFCTYSCCMAYQSRYSAMMDSPAISPNTETNVPIISSVTSLASKSSSTSSAIEAATPAHSVGSPSVITAATSAPPAQHIKIVQQTFIRPSPVKTLSNKSTSCKPNVSSKGVMNKPQMAAKSCQTDFEEKKTHALVPIPVPIYVPVPLAMYSFPLPMPVPFPLPIPVPMFIPTTRNSAKGIFKEIKRITDQVPNDPYEAELLMMAEMVASDKKGNVTSDSDDDDDRGNVDLGAPSPINDSDDNADPPTPAAPNEPVNTSFGGEDILQMAVNMAMEMTEPPPPPPQTQSLDLETVLTPQPVVPIQPPPLSTLAEERNEPPQRGRKRGRGRGSANNNWTSAKRTRTSSRDISHHQELVPHHEPVHEKTTLDGDNDPVIEPDPDLQLKFSYGVLAFRKWIKEKNSELTELALSGKAAKLFKTDILQLSTEELNFTLCMFVKEVRKPDGDEYAPDIIFYLCLGIQLYLYRSGRVDNIFTDAFYEKFTECLNQISSKFIARLNDRTLLTRVEEEHLWESQQLGAHSPHVLLFTLMYFNTKYFYLTEVEDHMRLSFTHVMKHWKRNNTQPGKSGPSRNVLLRYYPPQSVLDADERKKKVYEQQENESNPLRCPVKLYEFYVSKCPESVRGRNDVFYLLPERSCVPDSPVWYSTMSMPKDAVGKMLNRIRMVREILCILHSLDYH
ncbi:zinc finger MYM-type protein 4 [Neocloeon triangulifer]|uniref:zinc finger MYM-type protein 4 n=1 Tax=Neocloeon triangulifer TaxID=2078957 RepID=UPI00286EC0CE|nr:zinc finger MYM-type protein 4 [Neocloeon triangulifer]